MQLCTTELWELLYDYSTFSMDFDCRVCTKLCRRKCTTTAWPEIYRRQLILWNNNVCALAQPVWLGGTG